MADCHRIPVRARWATTVSRRLSTWVPLLLAAGLAHAAPAGAQDLAFVSERDGNPEIYVMAADGSAQRNVSSDHAEDRDPAWSPDGARIVFARLSGSGAGLWTIAADGRGARRLPGAAAGDRSPAWSPDGRRIAFVSDRSEGAEVHVMDADGSDVVQVTRSGGVAAAPAWSPDGRRIAYWTEDTAQVHLVGPDGSGDEAIGGGFDRADRDPAWSPDGSRLAFATLRDPATDLDIFRMNLDGTDQVALEASPGRDIDPAWSADGRVAFASDRDGDLEIYVSAPDGADAQRLTTAAGDDGAPAWRPGAATAAMPDGGDPIEIGAPSPIRSGRVRISLRAARVRLARGRLVVTIRYRLNVAAAGTFRVHRRGRVVLRARHRGRRGTNVLTLSRRATRRARWRGRYTLTVTDLRPRA